MKGQVEYFRHIILEIVTLCLWHLYPTGSLSLNFICDMLPNRSLSQIHPSIIPFCIGGLTLVLA